MKRFLVILLCLILYTTLFTSCPGRNAGTNGEAETPKEIRVLLADHPYGNLLIPLIPEFERETGIKVIFEQLKENELNSRLTEEFTAGGCAADVFMTRPIQETLFFLKNDWIAPITNYDFSDYPQNTAEIGLKDGKLHVVPLIVEWQVLFYRRDLLTAAGLNVPANFDELENAARVLNRDGVYGFGSRGAGFAAVTQISSFIYNFGGRYIENGTAAFASSEAVEAFRYYGRILGIYGPQGVQNMSWNEILPIFQEGRLAMWTDASVFYSQLIDPLVSKVPAENVGVAILPRGPVTNEPYIISSWGMSISSRTSDMDSSAKFLEWATSKEMAKKAMLANITMARTSVWNDTSITSLLNPGIVETMIHASQYGYPYAMPFMTSIVRGRELIGDVISESINTRGTSPRLHVIAAQRASDLNDLLKTDGEYGTAK